jgi:hypothetical protein
MLRAENIQLFDGTTSVNLFVWRIANMVKMYEEATILHALPLTTRSGRFDSIPPCNSIIRGKKPPRARHGNVTLSWLNGT